MFVQIEDYLVERVAALVPEIAGRTPSIGDLIEGEQVPTCPAVAIAYDGYTPVAEAGCDNLIESRWLLVVAITSAKQRDPARAARSSALGIAGRLLTGLVGLRPAVGYTEFEVAPPGGPLWRKDKGLYLLPVAVSTQHVVTGGGDE